MRLTFKKPAASLSFANMLSCHHVLLWNLVMYSETSVFAHVIILPLPHSLLPYILHNYVRPSHLKHGCTSQGFMNMFPYQDIPWLVMSVINWAMVLRTSCMTNWIFYNYMYIYIYIYIKCWNARRASFLIRRIRQSSFCLLWWYFKME